MAQALQAAFAHNWAMTYSHVSIRLGGLQVEIGTETSYPDMITDITNRTLATFHSAMEKAKENGVDVSNMRLITSDYGDDYDEED